MRCNNCFGVSVVEDCHFVMANGKLEPVIREDVGRYDVSRLLSLTICPRCGLVVSGSAGERIVSEFSSPALMRPRFYYKNKETPNAGERSGVLSGTILQDEESIQA